MRVCAWQIEVRNLGAVKRRRLWWWRKREEEEKEEEEGLRGR
jgi:hypothetical protein